jgi:quercetin dioxygenase-like cupin family protein
MAKERMSAPFIALVADQQRLEWVRGGIMSVLLDGDSTNDQVAVLRSQLPRGSAVPVHVHAEEDEICVVIEGTGVFWVGEEQRTLVAGDVAE